MSARDDAQPIQVLLMNEYSVDMPLWVNHEPTDGDDLGLSDELRSDLYAFAARWEASIPPETYDDRFDDRPAIRRIVELGRGARRALHPKAQAAAEAELVAMAREGERLRDSLQAELGDRYVVTYVG